MGSLILKHTTQNAAQGHWAVVKYIGSNAKGVGAMLQQRCMVYCLQELNLREVYAGAWLEYENSWLSHFRWGYDVCSHDEWPRGIPSYGGGILSMVRRF